MLLDFNLCCRAALLDLLELRSDFFQDTLVRTERELQHRRCQRALRLLHSISDGQKYIGVIDLLLALCSPAWAREIRLYYDGRRPRLIEYVEWPVIDELDRILAQVVVELGDLYAAYEELGWREGQTTVEYDEVTSVGLSWFVGPRMPLPPEQIEIVRAAC